MPSVGSNGTTPSPDPIACPTLTFPGYDDTTNQYYCDYEPWAYGIFAIAGLLLILLPIVSIICCMVRHRDIKQKIRRGRTRVFVGDYTSNSYTSSENPYQPLIRDGHQNIVSSYGALENETEEDSRFSPNSISENPSQHQDDSSMTSKTSLLPNYDQASLDLRNTSTTNLHVPKQPGPASGSHNPKTTEATPEGPAGIASNVSPYMATNLIEPNLVPDSFSHAKNKCDNPSSPIYAVLEEAIPEENHQQQDGLGNAACVEEPVYAVLEKPLNTGTTTPENEQEADADNNELNDRSGSPLYNTLEPPSNVPTEENNSEIQSQPVEENVYQSLIKNDRQPAETVSKKHSPVDDANDDNTDYNEHEEPRYMGLLPQNNQQIPALSDEATEHPPAVTESEPDLPQKPRERFKSRADYEEFLLDVIQNYPEDERNGCFVLRDSVTSVGSKALTVYNKTLGNKQEVFNFKICFDEESQVYLAKSTKRFPALEELLEYLRIHKEMLPCTLKNQILTTPK